jgi:hypothetical protein
VPSGSWHYYCSYCSFTWNVLNGGQYWWRGRTAYIDIPDDF